MLFTVVFLKLGPSLINWVRSSSVFKVVCLQYWTFLVFSQLPRKSESADHLEKNPFLHCVLRLHLYMPLTQILFKCL